MRYLSLLLLLLAQPVQSQELLCVCDHKLLLSKLDEVKQVTKRGQEAAKMGEIKAMEHLEAILSGKSEEELIESFSEFATQVSTVTQTSNTIVGINMEFISTCELIPASEYRY